MGSKLLLVVLALMVVTSVAGAAWFFFNRSMGGQRIDLVLHAVKRERLRVPIVERGNLESADNHDVICMVKAGSKGSTVASTIRWVIDDGSQVVKGDKLLELDSSGLEEQLKTQKITLDQAQAAMIAAEETLKIQQSQNISDIETAENAIKLARIDLEKYIKGDYQQTVKDIEGRMLIAKSDMEQWQDRAAWSQRMVARKYATATQAEADQSRLRSAEIALKKIQEEKRVLEDPTYGMKARTVTDLEAKFKEAERTLDRNQKQANSREVTAKSDFSAKKNIHTQENDRYHDIEAEIKKCIINAPQDGLVVYYVSEQSRFGSGSQQGIVAQGEPVREGQKLMRIPDLKRMLVNAKVHEAMVSRVHEGLTGTVRIDAFPDKLLQAHVKTVATVASQQDWMSSDVKLYQTMVAIDESVDGLKPGMSAEVTIQTEAQADNVLTVPVQAIISTNDMGKYRKCFVKLSNGQTEPRRILVGLSNERMAEIRDEAETLAGLSGEEKAELKSGLKEGDEVVLNPRVLLSEKDKANLVTGDKLTSNGNKGSNEAGKPAGAPAGGPPATATPPAGGPPKTGAGGPPGAAPGGVPQVSAEDRKKQMEKFQKASPEERKQLLQAVPAEVRDRVKQGLEAQGLKVAD